MNFKSHFARLSIFLSFCFAIIILCSFTTSKQMGKQMSFRSVLVDTVSPDSSSRKIYEIVEKEAFFEGEEAGWRAYLEANLNANTPVDNGAPAGTYTVYIQFVVNIDGKIADIKALTRHGYGMETEVMRILRKSPPWIPAVQNGRPVRAYRKQPVTFRVTVEKRKRKNR